MEKELQDKYFILLYRRKKKENEKDFIINESNKKINLTAKCIYSEETESEGIFLYKKVFHFKYEITKKIVKSDKNEVAGKQTNSKKESKKESINFEFEIDKDKYLASFNIDVENSFIYDVKLKSGDKIFGGIVSNVIKQDIIKYNEKMILFIEALKKNKQEKLINKLYKETIKLYKTKKGFEFLISLFVQIYEDKDLCNSLMELVTTLDEKNLDRPSSLSSYKEKINAIASGAETLLKKNKTKQIEFYGILFCYLNTYDCENFDKYVKNLYDTKKEVLFEIILVYYSHLNNPMKEDKNFFDQFIKYTISNKKFSELENGLKFIKDLEIFLFVIEANKENIINKYAIKDNSKMIEFKPIKLDSNLNHKKVNFELMKTKITDKISSIIEISREEKILLIYFTNNFWNGMLNIYNEPNQSNINICYNLRAKFIDYYNLVKEIYKGKGKINIKNEAESLYDIDRFTFILDKMIKKYIETNKKEKELGNSDILNFITKFNPIYKEEKYILKRDVNIFDNIDFNNIEEKEKQNFIDNFRKNNFEIIFKSNIGIFLEKIINKIENCFHFDIVIDLIDIKKIEKDFGTFLDKLKEKYNKVIKSQIESLKGDELEKGVKIISNFFDLVYKEKKSYVEKEFLDKLDKSISPYVFNELLKKCKDDDYDELKKYIFVEILKNFHNSEKILDLIDKLEEKDKYNFLGDLLTKLLFSKEEFYLSNSNLKIEFLCKLYDKGKLSELEKLNDESFENFENLLREIKKDLDGDIKISLLKKFLKNKEEVIKKFKLIKIILPEFNPEDMYQELEQQISKFNSEKQKLEYIKNHLKIFHGEIYRKTIIEIIEQEKELDIAKINCFGNNKKIQDLINDLDINKLCKKVESVKDFLLFRIIYDDAYGENQKNRFDEAYNSYDKIKTLFKTEDDKNPIDPNEIYRKEKSIFNKIREILSVNESKTDDFIQQMIKHFELKDKQLIEDLTLIFKSKKYEMDIKSIFYFFKFFRKDNGNWNEDKVRKYEKLGEKGNEFSLDELKQHLKELNENSIYDYKNIGNYFKIFTSLFDKKEAIDFLILKSESNEDNILLLKDKLEPTNKTISLKDIEDTNNSIKIFKELKKLKSNDEILSNIKLLKDEQISSFENYSKIYSLIIELDTEGYISENLYEKVNYIIQDANFLIKQDKEELRYHNKITTIEDLIHLKNKIHIQKDMRNKDEEMKKKCNKMDFFRDTINNLEIIYDYMKILRIKGSSLPIEISIEIKEKNSIPFIKYFLDNKETKFEEIRNYLYNAKEDYISQLELMYKEKENIRFLYGKEFRTFMKNFEGGYDIAPLLRFILNKKDNSDSIKYGTDVMARSNKDNIEGYNSYIKDSFNKISCYITNLFLNNDLTIEKHYKKMEIKSQKKDEFKGIYFCECEKNSMEKVIMDKFIEMTGNLPIAQNVLISCKATSYEEMQAFFHRAILCKYYTLFMIEINDSFSDLQKSIMHNFIDKVLTYKYDKFPKKEKVDKKKINKYLDSCIIFVYDKTNFNPSSFKFEIQIIEATKKNSANTTSIGCKSPKNDINILNNESNGIINSISSDISGINDNLRDIREELFKGIKIVRSSICGLGKSKKIRNMIRKSGKNYYHFPLGGTLTKDYIFNKLNNLLSKMENRDYQKNAIHLDLTESKETSILNEFFFSFFITKFYTNNEDIIYIPNDIEIYVEIPNCFENYLSKFGILNEFYKENDDLYITFENQPKLDLSKDIISVFQKMSKGDSNEKIEKFIKENIGIQKYSYHQVNIFIKLFISQYIKFKEKIKFKKNGKESTTDCIESFVNCSKYFTSNEFSKLLLENESKNIENIYLILSKKYEADWTNKNFKHPLIFIIKEKAKYHELFIPSESSKTLKYNSTIDYLEGIKLAMDLSNSVKEDNNDKKSLLSIIQNKTDNYIITDDNFKKMALILYRIQANIPVILMGETGCGKTSLIIKLNQLLNNGKTTLEIINMHSGFSDEDIIKKMKEINEKAKQQNNEELWVFFDEINTCLSLSLMVEIFINRTFNTEKIDKNIRLIGACNPYRKIEKNKELCGLTRPNDKEDGLVYSVQPLPQSLLFYVYSFGSISDNDEKEYIKNIIKTLFNDNEEIMKDNTSEAIHECHKYLREKFDTSVVSLREIVRFKKCVEFFKQYYSIKNIYENEEKNEKNEINEKVVKKKSIINSLYLCYYIRLSSELKVQFNQLLMPILLRLVNDIKQEDNENSTNQGKDDEKKSNIMDQIQNADFKNDIEKIKEIKEFHDILEIEEDFLLDKVKLDVGIGKNESIKQNLFLLFLSLITKIPLIIIGKPGSGKSLSAQLITKSMRGIYSKNKFFQKFPKVNQTYFQGSESTKPEEIERLFETAKTKINNNNSDKKPISMILIDELGLADRSESNPFKVLHSKIEYVGKEEDPSFIGISNYTLDAAKMNRVLCLSVPDLDKRKDELIKTCRSIVESISKNLKDHIIFEILSNTYYNYKEFLKDVKELIALKNYIKVYNNKDYNFDEVKSIKNKEYQNLLKKEKKIKMDFHGNRDFYNLIKGIAIELSRLNPQLENDFISIIEKYIERNFAGIEYEIEIDDEIIKYLNDEEKQKTIKNILTLANTENNGENKGKEVKGKKEKKIRSTFIFKYLYNEECKNCKKRKYNDDNLEIKAPNSYDLNRCIIDNINDKNSRYLLLEIKPSLAPLIFQNIKLQNIDKEIIPFDGSPFAEDNNKEYRFLKVNEIQEYASKGKLIVMQNLNQIHPFLYDLYNKNFIINCGKKFARICLDNFNEQLTLVDDSFRVIIFVDKKFINEVDFAFLNRFEKIIITFNDLLEKEQKIIARNIIDEINFNFYINEVSTNYLLKDLLINCSNEEIEGLVYNSCLEIKNNKCEIKEEDIKKNVYNKIYKILPQDIISIFPKDSKIRFLYDNEKIYYNLEDYLNSDIKNKYKISFIYTFNSISNIIYGIDNEIKFMVSEIKTENNLKNTINEKKTKLKNRKIIIILI